MIMPYLVGLLIVVIVGATLCSIVQYVENTWSNKVMACDIEELNRLFDEEDSFVGFNDKGEKFLCGYIKDSQCL
jgi:hypothetical protein